MSAFAMLEDVSPDIRLQPGINDIRAVQNGRQEVIHLSSIMNSRISPNPIGEFLTPQIRLPTGLVFIRDMGNDGQEAINLSEMLSLVTSGITAREIGQVLGQEWSRIPQLIALGDQLEEGPWKDVLERLGEALDHRVPFRFEALPYEICGMIADLVVIKDAPLRYHNTSFNRRYYPAFVDAFGFKLVSKNVSQVVTASFYRNVFDLTQVQNIPVSFRWSLEQHLMNVKLTLFASNKATDASRINLIKFSRRLKSVSIILDANWFGEKPAKNKNRKHQNEPRLAKFKDLTNLDALMEIRGAQVVSLTTKGLDLIEGSKRFNTIRLRNNAFHDFNFNVDELQAFLDFLAGLMRQPRTVFESVGGPPLDVKDKDRLWRVPIAAAGEEGDDQ